MKKAEISSYRKVMRGELYFADLSPVVGSEQGGVRPVLVVQNNMGNRHSPTVIVAALTSRSTKADLPTHVLVSKDMSGLKCDSTILMEQIRTIDRERLKEYIGCLDSRRMGQVDRALMVSLGVEDHTTSRFTVAPSYDHHMYPQCGQPASL